MVSRNAPIAPTNAAMGVANPARGMMATPARRDSVAPRAAPDDMPVTYGSTSGLRIRACITTPETDRPIPTPMTATDRTTRSQMIRSCGTDMSGPKLEMMFSR